MSSLHRVLNCFKFFTFISIINYYPVNTHSIIDYWKYLKVASWLHITHVCSFMQILDKYDFSSWQISDIILGSVDVLGGWWQGSAILYKRQCGWLCVLFEPGLHSASVTCIILHYIKFNVKKCRSQKHFGHFTFKFKVKKSKKKTMERTPRTDAISF